MPNIPSEAHRIDIPDYPAYVGKVRHTYALDEQHKLFVASDRLSTYDVVHPTAIPEKGKILTHMSVFWFRMADELGLRHHLVTADTQDILSRYPKLEPFEEQIDGRSMLVRSGKVFPVEAIVRGNITGSGWKDYQKTGAVCGIELPKGLKNCQELDPPLFTPSTKAQEGHDQNISFEHACEIAGGDVMEEIRRQSLLLFTSAREYAKQKGIIIADTKFEFADIDGEITLVDEVLTPDSSRFWPMETFQIGRDQDSLDKQFVRNYVTGLGWNKEPPAPEIPGEIVTVTREKYIQAYERLTGLRIDL